MFGRKVRELREDMVPTVCVVTGAALWGIIGLFTRSLYDSGMSPMQMAFCRCIVTTAIVLTVILVVDRKLLRIDPRDIWMFIGTGLLSIVFFNIMYFTSQQMVSLSTASVLLYTAPCFVMVMSMVLFHERLTRNKAIALALAFAGCVFTTGLGFGDVNMGIAFGILAGFGYALYSIFAKFAIPKYGLLTILLYTFLIASLCLLPFCNVPEIASLCGDWHVPICVLGLAVISTVLPYYFYTKGLKGMDAGRASILAFMEPMVATILSLVIGDPFGWTNVVGIVMILGSVILLSTRENDGEDHASV